MQYRVEMHYQCPAPFYRPDDSCIGTPSFNGKIKFEMHFDFYEKVTVGSVLCIQNVCNKYLLILVLLLFFATALNVVVKEIALFDCNFLMAVL